MPTTIFSAGPLSTDASIQGVTVRNVLAITGNAQGQTRVTFVAGSGGAFNADHCSIGISNGTLSDTTATPVELKFGGASGFSIAANATITSDWVNFAGYTSANLLVVILDADATLSAHEGSITSGNPNSEWFGTSGSGYPSWNVATFGGGGGNNTNLSAVSLIETQSTANIQGGSLLGGAYAEW